MAFVRTNVVLDDDLIKRVMERYGFGTRRETIDFALRRLDAPEDVGGIRTALVREPGEALLHGLQRSLHRTRHGVVKRDPAA